MKNNRRKVTFEELKNYPKHKGQKIIQLKYTFEDWKNGTFEGRKFDAGIIWGSCMDGYFSIDEIEDGSAVFVEVPQKVATKILSEQKKIYHKTVEHLSRNYIKEFHRQFDMRGNGQKLLKREIEELEKLFFEENLSTKGRNEGKIFTFKMVLSLYGEEKKVMSEGIKLSSHKIDTIRIFYEKVILDKKPKYSNVKPGLNIDTEDRGIRVEAWNKYRLHLIDFRDSKIRDTNTEVTSNREDFDFMPELQVDNEQTLIEKITFFKNERIITSDTGKKFELDIQINKMESQLVALRKQQQNK